MFLKETPFYFRLVRSRYLYVFCPAQYKEGTKYKTRVNTQSKHNIVLGFLRRRIMVDPGSGDLYYMLHTRRLREDITPLDFGERAGFARGPGRSLSSDDHSRTWTGLLDRAQRLGSAFRRSAGSSIMHRGPKKPLTQTTSLFKSPLTLVSPVFAHVPPIS